MAITFRCSCGKSLRVADSAAGHKARCPACSAVVLVPAAAPLPAHAAGAQNTASPDPRDTPPDFFSSDPAPRPAPAAPGAPSHGGMLSYSSAFPAGIMTTGRTITLLAETKPWVRFIGVMAFIGAGLLALLGLLVVIVGMAFPGGRTEPVLSIVYFIFAGLYLPAGFFLNRYASHIASLLVRQHASDLEAALEAQKSFWRYLGIIILVVTIIYALVLLLVAAAIVMRLAAHR